MLKLSQKESSSLRMNKTLGFNDFVVSSRAPTACQRELLAKCE